MQDILPPTQVFCHIASQSKKQLFQDIAQEAAAALGVSSHLVFDVLWEREQLGTTGVGHGIAIPHGKLPGLDGVHGFFIRLAQPIAYAAVDEQPVDLVFMLLAPAESGADHLQALSQISKVMRDPAFCAECRKARNAALLHGMLQREVQLRAA